MTVGLTGGLEIVAALFMASKDKISFDSYEGVKGQEKTEAGYRPHGSQDLGNPSQAQGPLEAMCVIADPKPR